MAHRVSAQRGNFGLEYILDKRDVAPEAGQPVVIGPYVIRFLAPTVRPEKSLNQGYLLTWTC